MMNKSLLTLSLVAALSATSINAVAQDKNIPRWLSAGFIAEKATEKNENKATKKLHHHLFCLYCSTAQYTIFTDHFAF